MSNAADWSNLHSNLVQRATRPRWFYLKLPVSCGSSDKKSGEIPQLSLSKFYLKLWKPYNLLPKLECFPDLKRTLLTNNDTSSKQSLPEQGTRQMGIPMKDMQSWTPLPTMNWHQTTGHYQLTDISLITYTDPYCCSLQMTINCY